MVTEKKKRIVWNCNRTLIWSLVQSNSFFKFVKRVAKYESLFDYKAREHLTSFYISIKKITFIGSLHN